MVKISIYQDFQQLIKSVHVKSIQKQHSNRIGCWFFLRHWDWKAQLAGGRILIFQLPKQTSDQARDVGARTHCSCKPTRVVGGDHGKQQIVGAIANEISLQSVFKILDAFWRVIYLFDLGGLFLMPSKYEKLWQLMMQHVFHRAELSRVWG